MSTRARKWLIFGIVVVLIAGTIGVLNYINFQKNKIPDDAVLGGLDVAMLQIEPTLIRSVMTDYTAETTNIYIFRPDGGMSIGTLDLEETGGFFVPEPGSVYFIKDDKVYCCDVVDQNWNVTDRKTWQSFAVFELRDGVPYIDDNHKVNDTAYSFFYHEDFHTWEEFIAQVNQKITGMMPASNAS